MVLMNDLISSPDVTQKMIHKCMEPMYILPLCIIPSKYIPEPLHLSDY